jgi:hypothetical protein
MLATVSANGNAPTHTSTLTTCADGLLVLALRGPTRARCWQYNTQLCMHQEGFFCQLLVRRTGLSARHTKPTVKSSANARLRVPQFRSVMSLETPLSVLVLVGDAQRTPHADLHVPPPVRKQGTEAWKTEKSSQNKSFGPRSSLFATGPTECNVCLGQRSCTPLPCVFVVVRPRCQAAMEGACFRGLVQTVCFDA